MPTLNVCVQIYMNKKNTQNFLKLNISLKRREIFVILIRCVCFFIHMCQLIPLHSCDYLNKVSIKTNVTTDEGNSRNEM